MQTADPLLGHALEGRYRIQTLLARGGMSTVYVGLDERLDRLVAIKVMSSGLSADPVFVDRFTREARAAARLSHVNVVSVYDQGNDSGHVFLVMELVRGRTLRDLLRESGPLSPAAAVSLLAPVLAALSAAHRAGLVHRDVKPENILLSDDGIVKVADFGLARAIEGDHGGTQTGMMMGTVAYCSPEQISQGAADQRSDVYSAGIVLFEMLTGSPPFRGESAMAVAYQHVHSRVPAPSDPAGTGRALPIPPQLDTLVQRATSREPAGRPIDAGAFLAELHDVRIDLALPITAVPARARQAPTGRDNGQRSIANTAATGRVGAVTTGRLGATPLGSNAAARGSGHHPPTVALPVPSPARHPAQAGAQLGPPPGSGDRTGGPPATQAQNRKRRRGRRRRALIAFLVVLVLGIAAAVGSWWFVSGRYTSVPDVRNSSSEQAASALDKAGLEVAGDPQTQFSETVPADHVIDTDPAPGGRILPGAHVTLIVSSGAERFDLPDLSSKTLDDAKAALGDMPVQLVPSQAADDTVARDQVIRTDPPAGTALRRDQVVTVFISTGPPVVVVPKVVGQTQDEAQGALEAAGFAPKATQDYSDTVAEGRVISQTPVGDTSAVKFTDVSIVVSRGPELITLPQLSNGTSVSAATATLQKLGLKVEVHKNFGGYLDQVVGMSPTAGTKVRKGSTVTLEAV